MKQLDMIKAMAELDGVGIGETQGKLWVKDEHGCFSWNRLGHKEYNPITDLALNCAARDKYEVEVEYWLDRVVIDGDTPSISTVVYFEQKSEIPRAIIECILKSKGLWK